MSDNNTNNFQKNLTQRHILFIALGSAIGTGLFYGAADAIRLAGPSVLFAYFISGLIAFIIMRALGEMALHNPISGSFARYANQYISPLAGFITGWSFIMELILVCLADITAFTTYMRFWYPEVEPWLFALSITLIICAMNLINVKIYGEFEFFLSLIKVLAIIAMILGGIAIIFFGFGTIDHHAIGLQNLWKNGGWFPHGWEGFFASFALTLFAFGGIETIGLAITETKDPQKNIAKAINTIPIRIILFYVLTIAVLIIIYPWNKIGVDGSPFVKMFSSLGIHSAANILNIIVISAAISAINSDIYGASRMLHGLSEEGQAFKKLNKLTKNGIPLPAVFLIFIILILGVILNYFFQEKLFLYIAVLSTFCQLIVWIMILLAQFFMRLKMTKEEQKKLSYPVPFWPFFPILSFLFIIFICFFLGKVTSLKALILAGAIWFAVLIIAFYSLKNVKKNHKNF